MRSTTAALLATCALLPLLNGCKPKQEAPEETAATTAPDEAPAPVATAPTDLVITELAAGNGATIAAGSTAVVHYTGWLYDPATAENKGAKFDSSRDRSEPFKFPLGKGAVIAGWDKGVEGMKVGQQVRLVIPPAMGYGESGAGDAIPPNSTLVFDVELLGIE